MDLVSSLSDRLLFAVPKKGRLHEPCLSLLAGSDIQFLRSHRLDIALVKNLPMALIFLPAADIPTFVGEGRVDLGITGKDQVAEHYDGYNNSGETLPRSRKRTLSDGSGRSSSGRSSRPNSRDEKNGVGSDGEKKEDGDVFEEGVVEIMPLGFGKCRLQVQVPKTAPDDPSALVGKNIVTSFTTLAEEYFRRMENKAGQEIIGGAGAELKTKIKYVGGSVEAACALGVADGIIDLVESGETMTAAGLKAIDTVYESEAVLIRNKRPRDSKLVDLITARIGGVITAQKYVLCTYNIERASLSNAVKLTPGRRAPTVNSLEEEGWIAVNVMIERKSMATIMDQIVEIGGRDILITKIENSRGV